MSNRELTKEEMRWVRRLKRCLKAQPKSLAIRQCNETSYLMFFDDDTADRIELEPEIPGFPEQDPTDNYKEAFK